MINFHISLIYVNRRLTRVQDHLMALYQLLWVYNVRRQDGKARDRISLDSKAYQTNMPNCCIVTLLLLHLPTGVYQLASLVHSFPYSKYLSGTVCMPNSLASKKQAKLKQSWAIGHGAAKMIMKNYY